MIKYCEANNNRFILWYRDNGDIDLIINNEVFNLKD